MSLTYTPTGEIGSPIPEFSLPSVDGKVYSHHDFSSAPALVVMFICNHCPYVRAIESRFLALGREFRPKGVAMIGICSNDSADHPEDASEALLRRWREMDYGFPYLVDEDQSVARAFAAVCTPDLFVFDGSHKLAYRGRLDDSWRNPAHVQKMELKNALERILANQRPPEPQNPSMGCSIKWKKG